MFRQTSKTAKGRGATLNHGAPPCGYEFGARCDLFHRPSINAVGEISHAAARGDAAVFLELRALTFRACLTTSAVRTCVVDPYYKYCTAAT